jgi:hypothetical protein
MSPSCRHRHVPKMFQQSDPADEMLGLPKSTEHPGLWVILALLAGCMAASLVVLASS